MSAETKTYEDKMTGVINHLVKEHATIRAGRANPAILDKVTVDYYGTSTPIKMCIRDRFRVSREMWM